MDALSEGRFELAVFDAGLDGLVPIAGTRVVYLGALQLPETLARQRQLGGEAHGVLVAEDMLDRVAKVVAIAPDALGETTPGRP